MEILFDLDTLERMPCIAFLALDDVEHLIHNPSTQGFTVTDGAIPVDVGDH